MTERFPNLTSPLKIAGLTLKNRMISAPTSVANLGVGNQYTMENREYYKLRAMGGAAMVTVGEGMVDLETGQSHPQQVGLNDPGSISTLTSLADAIHAGGAAASMELDHGGALCEPEYLANHQPIGPSHYIDPWGDEIMEMTEEQIYIIADKFASAAANCKMCGFDAVMIHSGHGWLLHQFISSLTNHRTDKWGGSLENRMRFPLLVVQKVRESVGKNFPIEVRMSGSERVKGGYDLDEGVRIAEMFDDYVDMIHVSAGTQQDYYSAVLMHPGIYQKDMENAYLAAEIRKHVKSPVVTVGAFNMPDDMEGFLADGHADVIALGRALIADPFLPKKVILGKPEEVTPCLRCMECFDSMMATRTMRCAVNPYIGREHEVFHPIPTNVKKTVLIAGGGPGGMEAALLAEKHGHKVILCEASDRLGALRYSDKNTDFKKMIRRYRDSQIKKIERSSVEVHLNTKVTKKIIDEVKPDALIIAVGSVPASIPIPGIDGSNVVQGATITDKTPIGDRVVVIGGGMVGCEEALDLARKGHEVKILEMLPEIGNGAGFMMKLNLMHQLETQENLSWETGMCCSRINEEGVYAKGESGKEILYPADTVVLSTGMCSRSMDVEELKKLVPEYYVIGDANRARKIISATSEAYDAVASLGLM